MFYLALSLLVLLIAPIIARVFDRTPQFEQLLSSFLLIVLGGIILIELLPDSYAYGGWLVIPFVLAGLTGPTIIERIFRKAADGTHLITLIIGFSGLLLHTMVDGASLNEFDSISSANPWLPLAIVLHRIPVALTVLWLIRPFSGLMGVWLALSALATFTLFGYVLGVQLESAMSSQEFAWLQSFVSGTLLHVLLHRPHKHNHSNKVSFEHSTTVDPTFSQSNTSLDQQHDNHSTSSHSHRQIHNKDHSHKHPLPFSDWGKFHFIGLILGVITLVLLSFTHH